MQQALGLVGAGLAAMGSGEPATRVRLCRHCLTPIEGRVMATYNGSPLCLGGDTEPNCYRLVSLYHHDMPCAGDPCPGEVPMEHDHGGDVSHG